MPTNMNPFAYTSRKDGKPAMFKGLVKAGSTQAIKMGEIVCLSKTYAGYFSPYATITLDYIYPLAITAEEQKSTDSERYISMYALAPGDAFEFPIDAARSLALGNNFVITTSNSQQLTYDADGNTIATQVDSGHYPQQTDTTVRNRSDATVEFNPAFTYYGLVMTKIGWNQPKVVNTTSALTLYDFMSGLMISNLGAGGDLIHVLPTTPPLGTNFTTLCIAAYDNGFEVGSQGAFFVEGAKQADDKNVSVDDEGDSCKAIYLGGGDWFAQCVVTSNADQTGAIDVEGG
jgi:hypothetical protein